MQALFSFYFIIISIAPNTARLNTSPPSGSFEQSIVVNVHLDMAGFVPIMAGSKNVHLNVV